jgi:hypothetical protein
MTTVLSVVGDAVKGRVTRFVFTLSSVEGLVSKKSCHHTNRSLVLQDLGDVFW